MLTTLIKGGAFGPLAEHSDCEAAVPPAVDRAAVQAPADQDQQAAAIDGAEDPAVPATCRTPCILARWP